MSETVTLSGEARLDLGASLFFRGLGLLKPCPPRGVYVTNPAES